MQQRHPVTPVGPQGNIDIRQVILCLNNFLLHYLQNTYYNGSNIGCLDDMRSGKVDQAIELVKDLIQSGSIRAGDRLPSEGDLSAQLGVSRNSLREAVRVMQAMRIVETRQGDGTYVSDLDPAASMDVLRFAVDISDTRSVIWYLEIRRLLEVTAAQEAAARHTAGDLARLEDVHARLMAEPDGPQIMTLDAEFHEVLGQIGSNPIQAALLRVISAPTLRARVWRQRLADDSCARIRREHQVILDAIRARDVEAARTAMWQHINQVILWLESNPDSMAARQPRQDQIADSAPDRR